MAGMGAWACTNCVSSDVRQRRLDVGVFRLHDEPEEAAVAVDEIELVTERYAFQFISVATGRRRGR